jgi:hypothetical protein
MFHSNLIPASKDARRLVGRSASKNASFVTQTKVQIKAVNVSDDTVHNIPLLIKGQPSSQGQWAEDSISGGLALILPYHFIQVHSRDKVTDLVKYIAAPDNRTVTIN